MTRFLLIITLSLSCSGAIADEPIKEALDKHAVFFEYYADQVDLCKHMLKAALDMSTQPECQVTESQHDKWVAAMDALEAAHGQTDFNQLSQQALRLLQDTARHIERTMSGLLYIRLASGQ